MVFEANCKTDNNKKIDALFAGWEETLIWSCLQNVMELS